MCYQYAVGVECMAQSERLSVHAVCFALDCCWKSELAVWKGARTYFKTTCCPLLLCASLRLPVCIQILNVRILPHYGHTSPSQGCKRLEVSIVWVDGADSHSAWH